MSLSKSEALRFAKLCISEDVSSVTCSSIARLWGGMGHIYRIETHNNKINKNNKKDHGRDDNTFVLKYMDPHFATNTKGKNGKISIGDQRKLDSYVVEAEFYKTYSTELRKQGVGLAKFLLVEQHDGKTILCLSVLESAPDHDKYYELVLEWLAHFHATTWRKDCPKLQSVGTYWHLDTRPQEWRDMSDKGWEGRLKLAAPAVDRWLKETPIQSWVHGDVKDANVMWDGNKVAMCDFQYVGRGCPLKDLCYFLCSSGVANDETLVDLYFEKLCGKLKEPINRRDFDAALELSYCDYLRFMCGWGQWGSDITDRVKKVLDKLDGGANLGSEEAYFTAIDVAFGTNTV